MIKTIDSRGLTCPQPVINAKKALEESDEIIIIVDNTTAVENLKRFAGSVNSKITETKKDDGYYLQITRNKNDSQELEDINLMDDTDETNDFDVVVEAVDLSSPTVITISDDSMGRGDRELGNLLIQGFIHTLLEISNKPDYLLFYNNGVKLVVEGSEVIDDLAELEKNGTTILACGTCLNFFNLKEKLKVGNVSNMYEILEAMTGTGKLIQI
jgi:selenium metabolism protein YedF